MNRVFICEHLNLKVPSNKGISSVSVTSVKRFCGETKSGSVIRILHDSFSDSDTRSLILDALVERLGASQVYESHARCFNTFDIESKNKDSRYRLRCASRFHNREQRSGLSVSEAIVEDDGLYVYGECMLFLTIGVTDMVICRMYKSINVEIENELSAKYIRDRIVFDSIMRNYSLLLGRQQLSKLFVIPADDVRRQEQLLRVNDDIVIVNHFCHSNVFSSIS